MPEIKHQFTGGKMNKDVNERLVPKGEYRHAMNIQVSTSEDSDVGTVQNILGNTKECAGLSLPPSSFTVGSIADEKNDSLYWFVSGQPYSFGNAESYVSDWTQFSDMTDSIVRKTNNGCEFVFVDRFAFTTPNSVYAPVNTLNDLPSDITNQIQVGWTVAGITDDGFISNTVTVTGITLGQNISATPNPDYIGSSLNVTLLLSPGGWQMPPHNNAIFVRNPNPNLNVSSLVGQQLHIDQTGQTTTIYSTAIVTIWSAPQIGGGSYGADYLKIVTDDDIIPFTPNINEFNEWLRANGEALGTSYQGHTITGSITDSSGIVTGIPTNDVFADASFDVGTNLTPGQGIALGNISGCVGVIDSVNNSFTLVDCSDGSMVGVPTVPFSFTLPEETIVSLDDTLLLDSNYDTLLFSKPRVLNFNHNEYITGINIIDDMLFWTDGKTEPKKINIPRSISGTMQTGLMHTRLINEDQDIHWLSGILTKEEHVTVIRKAPPLAPFLEIDTVGRPGITSGEEVYGFNQYAPGFTPFSGKVIDDQVWLLIPEIDDIHPNFKVGDILRLAVDHADLPDDYDIRVRVIQKEPGPFTGADPQGNTIVDAGYMETAYLVRIESMTDEVQLSNTTTVENWFAELESIDVLFKSKLPRFACRYKYKDGEYSSFSPFTQVAFVPGNFNYEPIEAYNKGMSNTIKSLTIKDFIPSTIPEDIIQVDLLYKNEIDPTIYLLKSISPEDNPIQGQPYNSWYSYGSSNSITAAKGSYEVSTENIFAALPSSQSLRVWDNVPKTAIAQELTGNRIVYGNYEHGYDITHTDDTNSILTPDIALSVDKRKIDDGSNIGSKSVKSLRSYDIGVVWGDKYGRETPVKTSSSSVTVPKTASVNSNYLKASLEDSPFWADYYRFYIKETSNEYYNLAVDRTYDAEDGNIWVSFPSVDRNKIDEDTYIILKKGIESDEAVQEQARYKVVAIENEAPEYIKTTFEIVIRTNTDATRPLHSCNMYDGSNNAPCSLPTGGRNAPTVGRKGFSLNKNSWSGNYDPATKQMQLTSPMVVWEEIAGNTSGDTTDELYVSFNREVTSVDGVTTITSSNKYHVVNVEEPTSATYYYIHIADQILAEDEFITDAYDGADTLTNDNIHVLFWKKTIINKPEFDGRFFVKILNDAAARAYIASEAGLINNWSVRAATTLHKIVDTSLTLVGDIYKANSANYTQSAVPGSTTNSESEWNNLLKFGTSSTQGKWFIDGATFASKAEGSQTISSYQNVTTSFSDPSGAWSTRKSCDTTTYHSHSYQNDCALGWISLDISDMLSWINWGGSNPDELVGTGSSNGVIGMKGVHEHGGNKYIDIAYSKFGPHGDRGKTTSTNVDWRIGDPANTDTDQEAPIISSMEPGVRFRLIGGNIIYRIIGVTKRKLFNYHGRNQYEFSKKETYLGCTLWNHRYLNQTYKMADSRNRRRSYRIQYEVDFINSPSYIDPTHTIDSSVIVNASETNPYFNISNLTAGGTAEAGILEFLQQFTSDDVNLISTNPAVFETEPKEDVDLDIYYEASSSIPTFPITNKNKYMFIPIGSILIPVPNPANSSNEISEGIFITNWNDIIPGSSDYIINLSTPITTSQFNWFTSQPLSNVIKDNGDIVSFTVSAGITTSLEIPIGSGNFVTMITAFKIIPEKEIGLNWFNCWSFNNGVESNRIGDTYNKPFVTNGVTVSSSTEETYEKEQRKSGLIYSGIYNSTSGINNLNQFIAAEKITKDLNPTYGSIQKLYSRSTADGDLIALCEDRVLKILANKDALYNADGNINLTATENVLGQAIPYAGEFGISKNPESFAAESYRCYFTDKVRGAIMRLSKDGLTPISMHGMKDWFRDKLKLSNELIGSYDDKKDEYNITIKGNTIAKTVTFREDVKGWVSFKSFTPENAISCANEYYTFVSGELWKHHDNAVDRNTFYGVSPGIESGEDPNAQSSVTVIFNEVPGSVKSFKTISYEGSQAKVTQPVVDGVVYEDGEYFNLTNIDGWYVDTFATNLEHGSITEFIKKEGKWFGYTIGDDVTMNPSTGAITSNYDTSDFSIQGIGRLASIADSTVWGCMDDGGTTNLDVLGDGSNIVGTFANPANPGIAAFNYSSAATLHDGSCIPVVLGCIDISADNFDAAANTDDGSCLWYGCTTYHGHINFCSYCNIDDGSCIDAFAGCWVSGMWNYDYGGYSNIACGGPYLAPGDGPGGNNLPVPQPADYCCIPFIPGCLDPNADNFIPLVSEDVDVNQDDGSCEYLGCTNPIALNYSFVGSSPMVDGPNGWFGYLNGTAIDNGTCNVPGGCMDNDPLSNDGIACNYDSIAVVDNGSCLYCGDSTAINYDSADVGCTANCIYCQPPTNIQIISQTTSDSTGSGDGEVTVTWQEPVNPSYGTVNHPNSYTITLYSGGAVINSFTINSSYGGGYPITGWGSGTLTWSWNGWPAGYFEIIIESNCINSTTSTSISISETMLATPIPGCTDGTGINMPSLVSINSTPIGAGTSYTWGACNYDPTATFDDGSCVYDTCLGCTDPAYIEYDSTVQLPIAADAVTLGYCTDLIIPGCQDPSMFNFAGTGNQNGISPPANTDCDGNLPGSSAWNAANASFGETFCCAITSYGCLDDTPNIYNSTQLYAAANYAGPGSSASPQANTPCDSQNSGCVPPNCNGAGTGNGQCCDTYNCPTIGINSIGTTAGYVELDWNVINTIYNPAYVDYTGLQQGVLSAVTSLVLEDSNGGIIYESSSDGIGNWQGGQANLSQYSQVTLSSDIYAYGGFSNGDIITLTYTFNTVDGACSVSQTQNYTVGCSDINAENYGNYDFAYNTICEYTGCTDGTMDADGQNNAADNYDPIFNIMCGASTDNACCIYTGDPKVELIVGGIQNNSIVEYFINTGTVYDEAAVTATIWGGSNLGPGNTWTGLTDPSGINTPGNPAGVPQLGVYGWGQYVVNGILQVTYNVDWAGDIINPSKGNTLTTSTTDVYQFTVGCRDGNSSHLNWDSALDLHEDGSCVDIVYGCTDVTATNYDPAANVDNNTCCYGCGAVSYLNPTINNQVLDPGGGQWYTSLAINWMPVNGADYYVLEFEVQGSLNPAISINITDPTAVQSGSFTIVPGTTLQTPNGGFDDETNYVFRLTAYCGACGPGNTATHVEFMNII